MVIDEKSAQILSKKITTTNQWDLFMEFRDQMNVYKPGGSLSGLRVLPNRVNFSKNSRSLFKVKWRNSHRKK